MRYAAVLLLLALMLCGCGGGSQAEVLTDARAKAQAAADTRLHAAIGLFAYSGPPAEEKIPGIADHLCSRAATLKRRPTEAELNTWLAEALPAGPGVAIERDHADSLGIGDALGWAVLARDKATFDRLFAPHAEDYAALSKRLKSEAPTTAQADEELTKFVFGRLSEAIDAETGKK